MVCQSACERLGHALGVAESVRPAAETMPQPKAGDAWVLRHILHDWNDVDAARILAAMRAAMGSMPVTLCLCEVNMPRLPTRNACATQAESPGQTDDITTC